MASKLVIIAGLLLVVAVIIKAESTELSDESNSDEEHPREKRFIAWIIASWGDALKYFLDGLNKGVKGLITAATYVWLGFGAGVANGLQLWRLGIIYAANGIVDFVQNVLTILLASPAHSNLLGENAP